MIPNPHHLVEKCLCFVLKSIQSNHFKVSNQALSFVQNRTILFKYFFQSKKSLTLNAQSGLSVSTTEKFLSLLVTALREGRNHWHPAVSTNCNSTLDLVFDYISNLDDEE
jgi:hypothetical protein